MWFLTHIRRLRTQHSVFLLMVLIPLPLCGCSSMPRLGDTSAQRTVQVTASGEIPEPIFDNPQPAARIASSQTSRSVVFAPKPFRWTELATSAGGRPIEGITIGQSGNRSLVIGSLAGHDPLAITLADKLARHIHENSIILGGIEATIIRNPNPDGEALKQFKNSNGVVLNRQFPSQAGVPKPIAAQEPEIRLLLSLLNEQQPQRVIHIRTYRGNEGVIAASSSASAVAKDVAEWASLSLFSLPGQSKQGTLERHLSETDSCEIVTFAFPERADQQTLWETYGDSLLNLLLHDDYETRKLARTNRVRTSADRRSRKDEPDAADKNAEVDGNQTPNRR